MLKLKHFTWKGKKVRIMLLVEIIELYCMVKEILVRCASGEAIQVA